MSQRKDLIACQHHGHNKRVGMIRTKFAAILLGAEGVGILAIFAAIQGIAGTVFGLGIQASAVREIAAATSKGDEETVARVVISMRRLNWLTGLVGMLAMMAMSPILSRLTFDSDAYTLDIAAFGIVILMINLNSGKLALLQGVRRIGDLARTNKLVRVVQGEVFDVAVDLRKSSPTFGQWVGVHLSADNHRQLWVPPGFAHGFVVLSESAEFLYKTTDYYAPQHERSLAWNDPAIGIDWPLERLDGQQPQLSAKDAVAKRLAEAELFS